VLPSDDADAARNARALLEDPRVTHFHDPEQHAGRAWGEVLALTGIAWDVYFLFDAESPWDSPAPAPRDWFHQLGGEQADPDHRRTAHELAVALHDAGRAAGWRMAPSAPAAADWDAVRTAAVARLQPGGEGGDDRCQTCRDLGRLSSCSLGGWRRLVLQRAVGSSIMASGMAPVSKRGERRELRLAVTGMQCPECMLRAGGGAIALAWVDEIEVRLDEGELRVLVGLGATADADELVAAVRAQGFGAEVMSAAPRT
jgi:hypothetical protein